MMTVVHFVGFRGEEYRSAVKVWGEPDFVHHWNDPRFRYSGEVGEADTVVFANGAEARPTAHSYDDSSHF